MRRLMFVLEGCRSRPDLEERMDWGHKGRVLVLEKTMSTVTPTGASRGWRRVRGDDGVDGRSLPSRDPHSAVGQLRTNAEVTGPWRDLLYGEFTPCTRSCARLDWWPMKLGYELVGRQFFSMVPRHARPRGPDSSALLYVGLVRPKTLRDLAVLPLASRC
jgi:hypothetical protein